MAQCRPLLCLVTTLHDVMHMTFPLQCDMSLLSLGLSLACGTEDCAMNFSVHKYSL